MESVFSSGYKGPCLSAAAAARSNAAGILCLLQAACGGGCPRPRHARASVLDHWPVIISPSAYSYNKSASQDLSLSHIYLPTVLLNTE